MVHGRATARVSGAPCGLFLWVPPQLTLRGPPKAGGLESTPPFAPLATALVHGLACTQSFLMWFTQWVALHPGENILFILPFSPPGRHLFFVSPSILSATLKDGVFQYFH